MTQLTDYIGSLIGGADLAAVPTVINVNITNTGGTDALILDATVARAGVMTAAQVEKLNGIADNANNYTHPSQTVRTASIDTGLLSGATVISDLDMNLSSNNQGHVTSCSFAVGTRVLTLANLGYTGDNNANYYLHPTHTPRTSSVDSGPLTGAQVISDIDMNLSSDSEGHVTSSGMSISTRALTPADIGAAEAGDIPALAAGAFTPNFIGASGGSMSGTCVWVTIGNLVIVTGQIKWTTAPTGTAQVRIGGFPYANSYETGFGYSGSNVENQANAANGMMLSMYAGASDVRLWGYNENGVRSLTDYNDMNSSGTININFSYYSTAVPT